MIESDVRQSKKTIVIAGASGFIGQTLGPILGNDYRLIGLSRTDSRRQDGYHSFRRTDLFALKDAQSALAGADYAIYLVHSMMPSARLVQGHFGDLDLLCADNFARAAAENGVKQIVYLGGLLPPEGALSDHLESRAEVERALGSTGVPVTCLRAGLIVGARGSSFQMLLRLVRRLPIMLCPSWTQTRMQPVAENDVGRAVEMVVGNPTFFGKTYDLGSPDIVSYRELMNLTSKALDLDRVFLPIPLLSPGFSRLWVSLTTGAPKALVAPLVASLRHEMIARPEYLLDVGESADVKTMLAKAIKDDAAARQKPRAFEGQKRFSDTTTVRSVQRMLLPTARDAEWASSEYMRWLPRGLNGLIRVRTLEDDRIVFRLWRRGPVLLELTPRAARSEPNRQIMRVTGGLLAKETERGRLEFRQVLDGRVLIAAIHEFEPRLPWWLYRISQALFHRWVMYRFGRHLATIEP